MPRDAPAQQSEDVATALRIRRNVLVGFGIGTFVAIALYVRYVAIPGAVHAHFYYAGLAFVVAVSLGGVFTAVLVAHRAFELGRD